MYVPPYDKISYELVVPRLFDDVTINALHSDRNCIQIIDSDPTVWEYLKENRFDLVGYLRNSEVLRREFYRAFKKWIRKQPRDSIIPHKLVWTISNQKQRIILFPDLDSLMRAEREIDIAKIMDL